MDQRTADSLFGSSDDGGADFFIPEPASELAPAQEVTDAGREQDGHETQTETPTHNSSSAVHEEPANEDNFDPYSSLRTSVRGTRASQTRQESGHVAAETNGYHTSYTATTNSTPGTSTYDTPPSHGKYDPYAAVVHSTPKPKYDPYAAAAPSPYAPPTQAQSNYFLPQSHQAYSSQSFEPAIPKPPSPKTIDVSKYRSTPNAYDPPIRSSPVVRTPSRQPPLPHSIGGQGSYGPVPGAKSPYASAPKTLPSKAQPPPPSQYASPVHHTPPPARQPPPTRTSSLVSPSPPSTHGAYVPPAAQKFSPPPPPRTTSPYATRPSTVPAAAAAPPPPPLARPAPPSNLNPNSLARSGSLPIPPNTHSWPNTTVPPPRPVSAAIPPSVLAQRSPPNTQARPGSVPLPPPGSAMGMNMGGHSRPSSAASVARQRMRSPLRASSITASSEGLRALDEDIFDPEGGEVTTRMLDGGLDNQEDDPTPTLSTRKDSYLNEESRRSIERERIPDPYPPMEADELLESLSQRRHSDDGGDPYASTQRPSASSNLNGNQFASPPPMVRGNASSSPPISRNVSSPPVPKAIPPPPKVAPRQDSYKPAGVASGVSKDPYAPSSAVTDVPNPYAPPSAQNSYAPPLSAQNAYAPPPSMAIPPLSAAIPTASQFIPPVQVMSSQPMPISTLAPNLGNVVDLSHSPPALRQMIAPYDAYTSTTAINAGPGSRRSTAGEGSEIYNQFAPAPYANAAPGPYSSYAPTQPILFPPDTSSLGAQYASQPPSATGAYAPSPSLLGTNDPLGRSAVRVPIFTFGFGGRVVSCFHHTPGMGAFDGMTPVRPSTLLNVKILKDIIPSSGYDVSEGAFPGPLFGDAGSGGVGGLVTTAAGVTKAKKSAVIGWLESKINEAEGEVGYIATKEGVEGAMVEGKLVLMKLLKVWIENDGKLMGSPSVEEAVRTVLLGEANDITTAGTAVPAFGYGAGGIFPGGASQSQNSTIAMYQVQASSLDHLQELLLRGDRRAAYRYALDAKLWAHALLISSSVDKDAWSEVAHEFIRMELATGENTGNRESLKVAYGLFSGDGPGAVKLLVPPMTFGVDGVQTHSRISSGATSNTFPLENVAEATAVPTQTWVQWKKLLAATIANQPTGDTSATTALGDYLMANGWIYAGHCCYLLSPITSVFSGIGAPGLRNALFGSADPIVSLGLLPIILSELVEFAKSLGPAVKGQEPFHGYPHLQAYRLWHATCLAEMGEIALAKRYTDAINTTIRSTQRGSPWYTHTFIEQLEELHDRLVEAPHADKTKAWISKPTVRSLNDWITGGLEKLIQGDETPQKEDTTEAKKSLEVAGPFSHYSSISSTAPSTLPSPSPSFTNLHASSVVARTGSDSGYRPPAMHSSTLPAPAPPRAASAMEPSKGRASPAAYKPNSAGAMSTSFPNRYQPSNNSAPSPTSEQPEEPAKPLYAQWWSDGNDDGVTPTATSFSNGLDSMGDTGNSGNFVSLMDNDPTLMPTVPVTSSGNGNHNHAAFDDDDDLGFGNSKKRKEDNEDAVTTSEGSSNQSSKNSPVTAQAASKTPTPATQATSGAAAPPAKGWFSWFGRRDSTPKPVVAKLGEESAFYFDADLGRWVNKKAGAEASTPKATPPPPLRAQTASPGRSNLVNSTSTPPPPRAASVMPMPPLAPPTRPSSTLSSMSGESPSSFSDSASPSRSSPAPPHGVPPRALGQTPPISGTASPAGSTSGRAAAKRNARSRYVDVFQATPGAESKP